MATDWVAMTGLAADDRYLMVNPYFHMFGLKAGILASVRAGATMLPEAVFDVDRVLERVAAERVTVLPGPPTLYQGILDHPDRDRYDLSTLRVAVTGAADIPVELIRRIDDELPFSSIITGYGLTEGGTAAATSPDDDVETIATTVGRPRPGFELRIVDGQGDEVPPGTAGEILLRGGSIMSHYLDDPAATAEVLSPDGWLSTGDLGVVDEGGCLRIVGRSKDMFIVGGFNAYPAEIENALLRHPDVQQVAVIGVPDERLGEVGMAFVVTRPGASVDRGGHRRRGAATRWPTTRCPGRWSSSTSSRSTPPARSSRTSCELVRPAAVRGRSRDRPASPTASRRSGTCGSSSSGCGSRRPSAAALLADWGADVIKVEPPSGDPMRNVFGSLGIGDDLPNPAFALDNRGKRSVVLDLREPDDRRRFEELLATADVFISNLRPDALDKLDLEPEATVARHPRLVYCSVSGYGLHGDDRNRPTYDIGAFWARSGLSRQMADGEGNPLNARGGIGDHITGLAALSGILGAVLEQRATGVGRVVEVSLLRTGAYVLGWDLGLQMTLGKVAGAEPRASQPGPIDEPVPHRGRSLVLLHRARGRSPHRPGLPRARAPRPARGRPLLERLGDPQEPRRGHRRCSTRSSPTRPFAEWVERFEREGVWWAPAQSPAEVVEDPQLIANDGFVEIDAGAATLRSVNGPVTFSGVARNPATAVPSLGAHTDQVLQELDERPSP